MRRLEAVVERPSHPLELGGGAPMERLKLLGRNTHLGGDADWVFAVEGAGMREVTVRKDALAESVAKNKAEHREVFLKAQEAYRRAVITELESRLADARAGKQVSSFIELEAPQDHTRDYERAERMLQMSTEDTIKLSASEFECFVMDRWPWAAQFGANTASYGIASKYGG